MHCHREKAGAVRFGLCCIFKPNQVCIFADSLSVVLGCKFFLMVVHGSLLELVVLVNYRAKELDGVLDVVS